MKNLLIVFEGLDGSGKTTQIDMLHQWFENINCQIKLDKSSLHM